MNPDDAITLARELRSITAEGLRDAESPLNPAWCHHSDPSLPTAFH